MKKIILFGATGHLGAYVADYLLSTIAGNNFQLITVGRRKTDFYSRKNIEYYQVDITKKNQFSQLPRDNIHAVLHFVGIMPAAMKGYDPYKYIDVNIRGTLNILEYCKIANADRILFTQTEADLSGHWKENIVIHPDMPRNFKPTGSYGPYIISKCAAVDLIESYWLTMGLKRFVFRLPTIYHYRENQYYYKNGEKTILGYRYLINRAIAGEGIEVWGNPRLGKDIVYVKDFAQMIQKALISKTNGGVYNVGTGVAVSIEDQIRGMIKVFCEAKPSKVIYCPHKPNSRSFVMNIANAKKDLGYTPAYDYISYLEDFKKEMKLNRFKTLFG